MAKYVKCKSWCVALLTLMAANAVSAQDAAPAQWTLQQCIDYALANNLDLMQKRVAVGLSDVDIEARKAALFPSLSFSTGQNVSWRPWSNSYVNITDGSMTSTTSTVNYNGTYGLQSQWTVWNGGINQKQIQRSKVSRQQTETDVESTSLSLQEQIVKIYVQILYQTEAVEVNRQVLESTKLQYQRAQAMYDVGTMSRADLSQMQAQVSQEEYNLANSQNQLAQFKLQLKQTLEIIGGDDFDIAVPAINDDSVLAMLPAAGDIYAQAVATRPETRYSQLGIDLAEMDIDIAKRGYYPTLSVNAGINTSATSGQHRDWGNQIKTNLSNMIGMSLSVPIFDRKQNATSVARAKLNKENAEIALAQQQKQLYNTIETYWLDAANAQNQYAFARINAASMRESYELVSEQFAVGLKDIVDLTTGKNNLLQAEQQLLQSKYMAVLNRALLQFYQGNPLTLE